ncbi:MAG: nucleotidyl transferase AbiEii/AbiGii toxin family protein [Sphingobacteriales bacterium]|nr:nucleotidyl transferase AbiEii/AbiGii toxin family protein [Sphingobacteriales bacterium]
MIKEWLEEYKPATQTDAEQALREIMQEIALAGLQRSGFFEKAAFYGGTALRIFQGLPRFSEDLDFSLLAANDEFSLEPYLRGIEAEFSALGVTVSVEEKNKTKETKVDSAFLKPDTTWKELVIKEIMPQESVKMRPAIKIKIEVDTRPPLDFTTEEKLLLKPFSFYVKCFTLPDLFAGKMHALLFRKWKGRVKGRDWFDMEWYIRKAVPLNLVHLGSRAYDSGDWPAPVISEANVMQLLDEKIDAVSFDNIKADVRPFIRDEKMMEIWSPGYFHDLIRKIKFVQRISFNEQWSMQQPLEYGRNIRLTFAKGNFQVRVHSATGQEYSWFVADDRNEFEIETGTIAGIMHPQISFKSVSGEMQVNVESP